MKKFFTLTYWQLQFRFWFNIGRPLNILEIKTLELKTEKQVVFLTKVSSTIPSNEIKVVLYEKLNGAVVDKKYLNQSGEWIDAIELDATPEECIFRFK